SRAFSASWSTSWSASSAVTKRYSTLRRRRSPTAAGYNTPQARSHLVQRIPIALIGCGGMGRRHLRGLARLATTSRSNVQLVAVCDLNQDNANFLADEAAELLGARPLVFADIEQMAQELGSDLQAASI